MPGPPVRLVHDWQLLSSGDVTEFNASFARSQFEGGDALNVGPARLDQVSPMGTNVQVFPLRTPNSIVPFVQMRFEMNGDADVSARFTSEFVDLRSACSGTGITPYVESDAVELRTELPSDLLLAGTGDGIPFRITSTSDDIVVWLEAITPTTSNADVFLQWDTLPTRLDFFASGQRRDSNEAIRLAGVPGRTLFGIVHSVDGPMSVRLRFSYLHPEGVRQLKIDTAEDLRLSQNAKAAVFDNLSRSARWLFGSTEGQYLIEEVQVWNSGSCNCGGKVCDGCIYPQQCTTSAGTPTGTRCEGNPGICATGNTCGGRANVNLVRSPPMALYTPDPPSAIAHELGHLWLGQIDEYVDHTLAPAANGSRVLCHADGICAISQMANSGRPNFCTELEHATDGDNAGHYAGLTNVLSPGLVCTETLATNQSDHLLAAVLFSTDLQDPRNAIWNQLPNVRHRYVTTPDPQVHQLHEGLKQLMPIIDMELP